MKARTPMAGVFPVAKQGTIGSGSEQMHFVYDLRGCLCGHSRFKTAIINRVMEGSGYAELFITEFFRSRFFGITANGLKLRI